MKCQLCKGRYEKKLIAHSQYYHGKLVVVDHVPALVCDICGDILYEPETTQKINNIIHAHRKPVRTAPVYEYKKAVG